VPSPDNLFKTLFDKFSVFERKLKPKVKARVMQPLETVSKAKIMIHVIRGTDVPVRTRYFDQFLKYLNNAKNENDNNKAYRQLYDFKQVETFLEVRLHDPDTGEEQVQKTSVSEG